MQDIARDNRVLSLVGRAGLRASLIQMLDQLQRCQKSLTEFLEVIFGFLLKKLRSVNTYAFNLTIFFLIVFTGVLSSLLYSPNNP